MNKSTEVIQNFFCFQRPKSGKSLFAEDILFQLPDYEKEDRTLKPRYGDFKPNYGKCMKEDYVSLVQLLVSGKFAKIIDPQHNPIKKQVQQLP